MRSFSLDGPTGCIHTPYAYVLPFNVFGAGIHRYDLKLNYGVLPAFELGVKTRLELNQRVEDMVGSGLLNAKFQVFKYEPWGFTSLIGCEAPMNFLASGYGVFGLSLERWLQGGLLSLGWGNERFKGWFGNAAFILMEGAQLIGDYDGADTHAGMRVLLSDRFKLDMILTDLNRIRWERPASESLSNMVWLGISYSEYIQYQFD